MKREPARTIGFSPAKLVAVALVSCTAAAEEPMERLSLFQDIGDGGGSPHDVRPYLELGRTFKVPVLGGVNGNTFWNYPVIMRRSLGLLRAGVDGIEFYESNNFAVADRKRWIVPLLGNEPLLEEFLKRSNLEACYPIWSRHAAAGHDDHFFGRKWSVYGPDSL